MWAAYIALVNQQLTTNGQPLIGFLNPTIYKLNEPSGALAPSYTTNWHDITSGTSGSYSATTGFDLTTGWGSPTYSLIGALTAAAPTSYFTLSATAATAQQGSAGTSTVTSTAIGGYADAVTLVASGMPAGVTVGYGTNPIAPAGGSSVLTFTVPSNTATGTYTITVTGTGSDGTTIETTSLTLTVTAAPSNFTIGASPTSLTVRRGSSGTSKITTAVTQGTITSISLSASGQKSGATVSFSPTSISGGNGSSTVKFTISSRATTGTYTVTITGTGGGNTHTTGISLTVQ